MWYKRRRVAKAAEVPPEGQVEYREPYSKSMMPEEGGAHKIAVLGLDCSGSEGEGPAATHSELQAAEQRAEHTL